MYFYALETPFDNVQYNYFFSWSYPNIFKTVLQILILKNVIAQLSARSDKDNCRIYLVFGVCILKCQRIVVIVYISQNNKRIIDLFVTVFYFMASM